MKFTLVVWSLFLIACRSETRSQSANADSARRGSESPAPAPKDTAGSGLEVDSILDAMREGSPTVVATSRGDTVESQGGVGFGGDTAHAYALEVYRWNGARFIRIKRIVNFKADGYPRWTTSLRTLIPAVADSGQWVVLQCQVASRDDPWVFGSVFGGPAPWQPRHAWRFDTTAAAVREISTTDVKCSHMLGYED
jgi:hypothetical protein